MTLMEAHSRADALDGPATTAGERALIHSHHYNLALVRTVLNAERVDARAIVGTAAADVAFRTLSERASAEHWLGRERWLGEVIGLFRSTGLGELDLAEVGETGGEARLARSHFAFGWREKFGKSKTPVCLAPAGYLSGALTSAFSRRLDVVEHSCAAQGKPDCRFRITPAEGPVGFTEEPISFGPSSLSLPDPGAPEFDEMAAMAALLDLPPVGDSNGDRHPGGPVTRLPADFYDHVSYRFERELPRVMGNKFANLASLVLTEAGHTSAFHHFGEIMRSAEWRERVVPLLRTREDWLHAAVAVINTLGWGTWRVHALVPGERASIRVYDGYEAAGYRRRFGLAATPKCYLARGTMAALMNLLYVGDITQCPELTPSYYNELFRSPLSFRAVEARCRVMGDPYCELIANPLSPGAAQMLARRS